MANSVGTLYVWAGIAIGVTALVVVLGSAFWAAGLSGRQRFAVLVVGLLQLTLGLFCVVIGAFSGLGDGDPPVLRWWHWLTFLLAAVAPLVLVGLRRSAPSVVALGAAIFPLLLLIFSYAER